MNIKKYIAVIIASSITLSCCPVLAANDIVFINQTFEDFATGEGVSKSTITPDVNAPTPQIVVYGSPNAEVVEDRKDNKALLFHEIENTTDIYSIIYNYPENLVMSMDIKLVDSSVKEVGFGLTNAVNAHATMFVSVQGNRLVRYDGKEIYKLSNKNKYYNIAVVMKKFKYLDIWVDGNCIESNVPMPQIRFSASVSRFIFKRTADDKKFMLDNLRVYEGKAPRGGFKNQAWNSHSYDYINVDNDMGDYLYFDSKNCDNKNGNYDLTKYRNFNTSLGRNSIVCNRLYHMDANRPNDWIIMTKSTSDQCYFDITLKRTMYIKDNAGVRDSRRTYNYYLIETDFMVGYTNQNLYLPMIYDNQTAYNAVSEYAITVMPNGGIKFADGTMSRKPIEFGKWVNSQVYVDVLNHTMDVYLDGELVREGMPINKNIDALTLVRWMYPSQAGGIAEVNFDNMKVTGLVEPYENGVLKKTSVFTDEVKERAYLSDKVAFSELNNLMFANGEKIRMTADQIFENNELYIPVEDAKKAFNCEIAIEGNNANVNGEVTILEKSTKNVNGIVYVPIMEFAEKALGKFVFHHPETGLIIIADNKVDLNTEEWTYMADRDFNKITILNDIDYLNNFIVNERPEGETLMKDSIAHMGSLDQHPRILMSQKDVERMKSLVGTDVKFTEIYNQLIDFAERKITEQHVYYRYNDPMRMAQDDYTIRMAAVCLAYVLTGEQKYFDYGYKELENIAQFPDYNISTVHDGGEWLQTMAIGYDWLYHGMTQEQRDYIAERLLNHCLKPFSEAVYGRLKGREDSSDWGNLKWFTNMNTISAAGIVVGAAAVADLDPEYCFDVISKALYAIEYPLSQCAPGGGWIEGPNYWHYHNESASYVMMTLREMLGSFYGLDKMKGYAQTGDFALAMLGPRGVNPLGDTSSSEYYLGRTLSMVGNIFNDRRLLDVRYETLVATGSKKSTVHAFDAICYMPEDTTSNMENEVKYGTYIGGIESYTIRKDKSINSENMFFVAHFGGTQHYHSQNDCGTFIFDIDGVRWAEDVGMDDYNLQNQLGYKQKDLYRYRAEGHNVLVINPDKSIGQLEPRWSYITAKDANQYSGYVAADMSDIYNGVESLTAGYYVGDDMQTVTIRYEMDLSKESEVYWFMHTKADLEKIGDIIYMSREGKSMAATYVCDAAESEILVMDATPLPTSPQAPEQTKNTGVRKIAVKIKGSGKVNLTVKLTPLGHGLSVDNIDTTPINQWKLKTESASAETPNLGFKAYVKGEEVNYDRKIRVTDGKVPQFTIVPENPESIIQVIDAQDLTGKTVVMIYDKTKQFADIKFYSFYEPYISKFEKHVEIPVSGVEVSSVPQPQNGEDNMLDDNMTTRWTCMALEEYAIFDLGAVKKIDAAALAFWKGDQRSYSYEIQLSEDGVNFRTVYNGASKIQSSDTDYNIVDISGSNARYIKYINHGNTGSGTAALNGNILEFKALLNK